MSGVLNFAKGLADSVVAKGSNILNAVFPPEKRAALLARLQAFAAENPKLAAFLLSNIALTGLPLLLFITFTITVFVFSLVVALLVAVVVALLFTVFMVLVALFFVLPTVFLTTMTACFIFVWGMGGYYIIKYFGETGAAPSGEAIGDKLNSFTGGRLNWLVDGAREAQIPNDHLHGGPKFDGALEEKKGLLGGKNEQESEDEDNGEEKKEKHAPKKIAKGHSGNTTAHKTQTKHTDGATKHTDTVKSKGTGMVGAADTAKSVAGQ